MEAIAYEKLAVYAARIPPTIYRTWQPPQLMRLIEEVEPLSTEPFALRMKREASGDQPEGPWIALGTHQTLKSRRLRKLYNKVGHHLHLRQPGVNDTVDDRLPAVDELMAIVEELRPAAASRMDGSLAAVVSFNCAVCEQTIVTNAESLPDRRTVECLQPGCGALYRWYRDGKDDLFHLDATAFECLTCGEATDVENRRLTIGFEFECRGCGEKHVFLEKRWGYAKVAEVEAANEQGGHPTDCPGAPEARGGG